MTRKTIQSEMDKLGVLRYAVIETAVNRLKGREYPAGSRGRDAYWGLTRNPDTDHRVTLRQWRAAYTLAGSILTGSCR